MRARRPFAMLALPPAAALGLVIAAACRRDPVSPTPGTPLGPSAAPTATEPGPAERTGQTLGEAADTAVEKAGQGAKSAASAVGSALEKTGETIKP